METTRRTFHFNAKTVNIETAVTEIIKHFMNITL